MKLLYILLGIVAMGAVLFPVVGAYLSAPGYKGPPSDHFDGKKFHTPGGQPTKGFMSVLKWQLNRDKGEWMDMMDAEPGPPPPTRVEGSQLRVTFINHATLLIQTEGLNIITDPVYSERTSPFSWIGPKRHRPPGIRFEDLPPIDVVLLSHNHYDHLDDATIKRIVQEHAPQVITPLGVGQYVEQISGSGYQDLDWWDEVPLSPQLSVQAIPAQHFSGRGTFDRDATLWCGYLLKGSGGNIWFAGDTGYNSMFETMGERLQPLRLSLLPIGAYRPEWFMAPVHIPPHDAVRIHQLVGSPQSIGMHYGTFPLADEGMHEPIEDLQKVLKEQEIPKDQFITLQEGEGREF